MVRTTSTYNNMDDRKRIKLSERCQAQNTYTVYSKFYEILGEAKL